MVQRRRATACRKTCRLRFILSTPSLALLLQSHPQSVLDMGGEDEPKVGMWTLEQKIDQPMDEETGRLKNMYREKAGVCEIVAAVSWFLGIVSVTGERTELGFSPAAAPALSNDVVWVPDLQKQDEMYVFSVSHKRVNILLGKSVRVWSKVVWIRNHLLIVLPICLARIDGMEGVTE
ncbi:hypothetical protein L1987_60894 [Smallanthus sonchifolius]|uniref:Uncharacterized protein n=1 Tax=Smallanthus sonchifolius TaxID=185202 RepID=A0ACB9D9B2_9ASTR|nr:hypothetical protein L1987_60894 [Smallanthus sonchifolius]